MFVEAFRRPFAEVNSKVGNSWSELERQNWIASKKIEDWNSKRAAGKLFEVNYETFFFTNVFVR